MVPHEVEPAEELGTGLADDREEERVGPHVAPHAGAVVDGVLQDCVVPLRGVGVRRFLVCARERVRVVERPAAQLPLRLRQHDPQVAAVGQPKDDAADRGASRLVRLQVHYRPQRLRWLRAQEQGRVQTAIDAYRVQRLDTEGVQAVPLAARIRARLGLAAARLAREQARPVEGQQEGEQGHDEDASVAERHGGGGERRPRA
mmetsp:Transcript_4518/g.11615  ORF Transcript_4518/g.11615 Transcript_4518/m.11615 type:complete len:202 (-) Transcript_4518:2-607(-)